MTRILAVLALVGALPRRHGLRRPSPTPTLRSRRERSVRPMRRRSAARGRLNSATGIATARIGSSKATTSPARTESNTRWTISCRSRSAARTRSRTSGRNHVDPWPASGTTQQRINSNAGSRSWCVTGAFPSARPSARSRKIGRRRMRGSSINRGAAMTHDRDREALSKERPTTLDQTLEEKT